MIVFYEVYADSAATFSNGDKINFNGALLSAESNVWCHFLLTSDEIDIKDFDSETFKLFLDCLMGFKEYTVTDALLIFPIACKYEVRKCIEKCTEVLKPTELNENVCLALNLALYYNCEKLTKLIIDDFLVEKFLIQKIFNEEKFCFLLEPESVSALLSKTKIDSYLIELVFKWGHNYLKGKIKSIDVKELFAAYDIDRYIQLECFEDIEAIFKFNESDLGLNFFTSQEILTYLRGKSAARSEWVHIKKEEVITETFCTDNENCFVSFNSFRLYITRNPVIFYEKPHALDKCGTDMIVWDVYYYKVESEKENGHRTRVEGSVNMERLCSQYKEGFFGHKTGLDKGKEEFKVEVRYKFLHDCRVLMTTFLPKSIGAKFVEKDPNELYFTCNIEMKKRN